MRRDEEQEIRHMAKQRRDTVPMLIRVPPEVRAWIEDRAKRSTASMGSEAVRALREVMDREIAQQRAARKREAAA
jgi:hypothetical protein